VVFTRKPPGDSFLVSTNFNVANTSNGNYPCERYETATKLLTKLVDQGGGITAEDAASVLQAVSTPGGSAWTLESLVADLPHGLVYLYFYRQFDKPVVLNVAEEIAHPRPQSRLSKLFPEEVRQEATRRYQRALSNQDLCSKIGKAWAGLVLASLLLLILFSLRKPRRLVFWFLVTLILGPLGLLIWLVAGRHQKTNSGQAALIEAIGHLPPVTMSFAVILVVFIVAPQAQANSVLMILLVFILPLLLAWLFYQGPLLAMAARRSYLRTLAQRLPAVWLTANLGMGCLTALTTPLVNRISLTCSVMELSIWTLVSIWTAIVAGAYLGFVLILIYENWAVHCGCRAWSVLATGDGEVSTPSWRKMWWWVLLSFAIVIGGVVVNNLLQQIF
jgi:hypothetical protein